MKIDVGTRTFVHFLNGHKTRCINLTRKHVWHIAYSCFQKVADLNSPINWILWFARQSNNRHILTKLVDLPVAQTNLHPVLLFHYLSNFWIIEYLLSIHMTSLAPKYWNIFPNNISCIGHFSISNFTKITFWIWWKLPDNYEEWYMKLCTS
jgi:hypothetical protein